MFPTLLPVVARAFRANFAIGNSFGQTFGIKIVNDWFSISSSPLLWVFNYNNMQWGLDLIECLH